MLCSPCTGASAGQWDTNILLACSEAPALGQFPVQALQLLNSCCFPTWEQATESLGIAYAQ